MAWNRIGNILGPRGAIGPQGVGIQNVVDNGNGQFDVVLTDGRIFSFVAPQGPQGPQGPPGQDGQDGTGVPIGGVIMWPSVNPIPNGFVICDGLNGTPDLRGRFVRGSNVAGGVGGSNTHIHSVECTQGGSDVTFNAGDCDRCPAGPKVGCGEPTTATNHLPPYYDMIFIIRIF